MHTHFRDIDLPALLPKLGFRTDDAQAFQDGIAQVSPQDQRAIDEAAAVLEASVGHMPRGTSPVGSVTLSHRLGDDFPMLAAMVLVAPSTQAELVRRGLDEDLAWRSVSDLGQQVHIHRLVHGRFGLSSREWVAENLTGSHLWLGRLQFTLEVAESAVGVHIPEAGPLSEDLVTEALAQASLIAPRIWPEHELTRFVCHSWLLDQGLRRALNPESNIAKFSARFTPFGVPDDGRRDALFFGFHVEPTPGQDVELDTLPADSSVRRAILAQLRTGGFTVQAGWTPFVA